MTKDIIRTNVIEIPQRGLFSKMKMQFRIPEKLALYLNINASGMLNHEENVKMKSNFIWKSRNKTCGMSAITVMIKCNIRMLTI